MNKGFISIIAVMVVFVLAAIMLGTANTSPKNISFKENFSDTKVFLGNYEILLNQKMQDFDWTQNDAAISAEIEAVSEEILEEITPPQTQCEEIFPLPENDYFVFFLTCSTKVISGEKTFFENNYTKKIYMKNYNTAQSTP